MEAHTLLEEQYRRSQKVRLKNKQEERLLQHVIDYPRGLKDIHRYRMEIVNREQKQISKERDRIRMGIERGLDSIPPALLGGSLESPSHNADYSSHPAARQRTERSKRRRADVSSRCSPKRSQPAPVHTTSRRGSLLTALGKDVEGSVINGQERAPLGLLRAEREHNGEEFSNSRSSSYGSNAEEEEVSTPDVNVLKAIMNGIVSDWEKDVLETISSNRNNHGCSSYLSTEESKIKAKSSKSVGRILANNNSRKKYVAANNNYTQIANRRRLSNASPLYSEQDIDSKSDGNLMVSRRPSFGRSSQHRGSLTTKSHRSGSIGDASVPRSNSRFKATRYSVPHI